MCQEQCYTSDMKVLATQVMEQSAQLPEGAPISAKALLHLGSRIALDQTLSRLARRGKLLRVGRGLYMRPIATKFGLRPPEVPTVLTQLAARTGETIASHGAAAANSLGLTTQIPMREVYVTSGQSRRLKLGAQTVELRHVPRWQLSMAGRPAGEAIRALAWLGPAQGSTMMQRIGKLLAPISVRELLEARGQLPTWMAEQVSALAQHG
jgi:hypothetical protein